MDIHMRYVVSACLAGQACRYDGKSNVCPEVQRLVEQGRALPVCPEVLGGLPTPRAPSEIVTRSPQGVALSVMTKNGHDVTQAFVLGAQKALELAQVAGCTVAIVKSRSPSCGACGVYDGSFSKTLISGQGVWASLLREAGFTLFTEEDAPHFER